LKLEEELEEEKDEPDRLSLLLPQSKFDCVGKQTGYYADEELNCEVFHYCQDNAKHSWICPEGFTFHQVRSIIRLQIIRLMIVEISIQLFRCIIYFSIYYAIKHQKYIMENCNKVDSLVEHYKHSILLKPNASLTLLAYMSMIGI
jgi:hypothetical protein